MGYSLTEEQLRNGKMFTLRGEKYGVIHNHSKKIRLLPFVTNLGTKIDEEIKMSYEEIVGNILTRIKGGLLLTPDWEDIICSIKKEIKVEEQDREILDEVILQYFFDGSHRLRTLSLPLMKYRKCEGVEKPKIAECLADVMGEKERVRRMIDDTEKRAKNDGNIFENLFIQKLEERTLKLTEISHNDSPPAFFPVTTCFRKPFMEDMEYILSDTKRIKDYLGLLFEFYFMTYAAQTTLKLNQMMTGIRDQVVPLYFCMENEKTSQSRKCYTDGWRKLQPACKNLFAHVNTLEILNHTETGSGSFDYIKLNEMASETSVADTEIAEKIKSATEFYRNAITDCREMSDLKFVQTENGKTYDAIQFLYLSVKTQFEGSIRNKPMKTFGDGFERHNSGFLRRRGRSGMMLTLTEEMLIFLTKICIKDCEKVRLIDVFTEFEKRGFFFDNTTKDYVSEFYEKLNLIEKKSDSGDAKYVKRIL